MYVISFRKKNYLWRKPRAHHRSEREANTRLRLSVGSAFQRATQMS